MNEYDERTAIENNSIRLTIEVVKIKMLDSISCKNHDKHSLSIRFNIEELMHNLRSNLR